MSGNLSSAPRGSERLSERRRTRRRILLVTFFILLLFLLAAVIYGLNQSIVRISRIEVFGADPSFAEYATDAMQGSYLGVISRDSIFFFPEELIRSNILSSNRNIVAVSIIRNGFTGISIKVDYRVPIARWCGSSPETRFDLNATSSKSNLVSACYLFDTSGFIYATTSPTQPINPFILYEAFVGSTSPIGTTLPSAEKLPATFDFARQLATFGSSVTSIAIHDDEVDDILVSGTRITYVLGHEQDAFTALVSAHNNFNLTDGSVDYVDLRFDGKVYLKKK